MLSESAQRHNSRDIITKRVSEETRRENADERRQFAGAGLELLRRALVERLRMHMEIFYEHGSIGDVSALCAAFDLLDRDNGYERPVCVRSQAELVEGLLNVLGLPAAELLERWPAAATQRLNGLASG